MTEIDTVGAKGLINVMTFTGTYSVLMDSKNLRVLGSCIAS